MCSVRRRARLNEVRREHMYEQEEAFLSRMEDPNDPSYGRDKIDRARLSGLLNEFPGLPQEYLAYLEEVGSGSVRECQYAIHEPEWCHEEPLFSWFECGNRKLVVFGHNFCGDLFAFDADNGYCIVELLHESMRVWPVEASFREFVRSEMLMGPDGEDQSVPYVPSQPTPG
jgi:hypothetical protein